MQFYNKGFAPHLTGRLCVNACVNRCAHDCGFFSTHLWGLDMNIWLDLSFIILCLCLPGLVHGPEPNPQQTREEEAFRGGDPDGHQSDRGRPARSACQEQQQVDIYLFSLFIIPPPNSGDPPDSWVYPFFRSVCAKERGGNPVTQNYITVSMVTANILPQFVGKEDILMNQESTGT